nr:FAD-dependent oxidoreductase [Pseudomonas sp.]
MDTRQCAVIGAGLVGLCTALELQKHGLSVTLIDAGRPGEGASWGNAGFLATESIDPLSTWSTLKGAPRLLLDKHGPLAIPRANLPAALPWLLRFAQAAAPSRVNEGRVALAALNRQAVSAWQSCLSTIGHPELLVRCGYLLVWESREDLAAARHEAEHLHAWNIPVELVTQDRFNELEPALEGKIHHALHFPDAYRMKDPAWLGKALFKAYEQAGGGACPFNTHKPHATDRASLGHKASGLFKSGLMRRGKQQHVA